MVYRTPILFAALLGLSLAPRGGRADETCAEAPARLAFPLAVEAAVLSDFGDPRGRNRTHEGTDLMAPKMVAVLAAASGTVRWMHDERGGSCCDVEIEHDDGWRTRYIHLNNDTPGTDDGKGWGFASGLCVGSRVERGQVIGFVGDSGNAEQAGSHLHFELRTPDGRAVDPAPHLLAAARQTVTAAATRQPVSTARREPVGTGGAAPSGR